MESGRKRSRMCRMNAKIANAVEEEEDIFHTKIPEPVITRILSFLPTKDTVRTSVLSKAWEHRWTSLTKLSLHDHRQNDLIDDQFVMLGRKRNFVRFVVRALILTDGKIMDNFSLFLFGRYKTSLLDTWFSSIFNRRRVKTLRIHSHFELSLSGLVTHLLFENNMLAEEFELHTDLISTIKVPIMSVSTEELESLTNSISLYNVPTPAKSICFKNLKFLKLCGIKFENDSPKSPRSILLSFPLLTKFETKNCLWFDKESAIFIIAPLLETISIQHDLYVPHDDSNLIITFCDSLHLNNITYCGHGYDGYGIPQDILIQSSCPASPKILFPVGNFMLDCFVFSIFSLFSHAKFIRFEASKVILLPKDLREFPLLTHLEVGLVNVGILLVLLEKTPVLKTLILKGIRKFSEERLSSAVVPECVASLHVVKFEEVNGDDHELFLAKFFMKNGMTLKNIFFSFASEILGKYEDVETFKEKLYSFHSFDSVAVEFNEM